MSTIKATETRPRNNNLARYLALDSREAKIFSISTKLSNCSDSLTTCSSPLNNNSLDFIATKTRENNFKSINNLGSKSINNPVQIQCPHCATMIDIAVVNPNIEHTLYDKSVIDNKDVKDNKSTTDNDTMSNDKVSDTMSNDKVSDIKCDNINTDLKDTKSDYKNDIKAVKLNAKDKIAYFNKFNPTTMNNFMAAIIGARNTGKTTLAANLLKLLSHKFNDVIIFSYSPLILDSLQGLFPDNCYYFLDDENIDAIEVINKIIEYQKLFPTNRTLILFDNFLFDKDVRKSKEIETICLNSRCLNISCIFTIQYIKDMMQNLRRNVNYIFSIGRLVPDQMKILQDWIDYVNVEKGEFFSVYENLTGDHGVFVCHTEGRDNDSRYMHYKAVL